MPRATLHFLHVALHPRSEENAEATKQLCLVGFISGEHDKNLSAFEPALEIYSPVIGALK